jgi:hypothetical protein
MQLIDAMGELLAGAKGERHFSTTPQTAVLQDMPEFWTDIQIIENGFETIHLVSTRAFARLRRFGLSPVYGRTKVPWALARCQSSSSQDGYGGERLFAKRKPNI